MGSALDLAGIDALLDVAPSAFATAQAEYLVDTKQNFDSSGNLRGDLPLANIVSQHTAEWGNRIDDLVRGLHQRSRGEARIGTAGTPETDHNAILSWNVAASRVQLLDPNASAYRVLQVSQLWLENGIRIISGTGTPEGSEVAGRGSVYTDDGTGFVYSKTTTSGSTGWSRIGAGAYREEFGFDTSTTTAEVYASWTSSVVETNSSGSPRTYNVWRAPVSGTITGVHMLHETNTTEVTAQWYETDGSTARGSSVTRTPTTYTLGAGTGYETAFVFDVDVSEGDLLTLGLDGVAAIGEAACWLTVTT